MELFVYGTLMSGFSRSRKLLHSRFIGVAYTKGLLYDLGGFPGLVKGEGRVFGELYDVNEQTLEVLDMIEGYEPSDLKNSLYVRKRVFTYNAPNKCLRGKNAFCYVYNGSVVGEKLITHGDYRLFCFDKNLDIDLSNF